MLRLTNAVPNIYVDESRDFQLLCRLYDSTNQGVRFNSTSMLNALTASKLNNRMLKLLADRVGFKTNQYIDDRVLRYILSAFPYIVKYKGTLYGIEQAVITILKAENSLEAPVITKDTEDSNMLIITTPITIYNRVALEELLKYVMPAGYGYNLNTGTRGQDRLTKVKTQDAGVALYNTTNYENAFSIIRTEKDKPGVNASSSEIEIASVTEEYITEMKDNLIGAVGTTVVTAKEE